MTQPEKRSELEHRLLHCHQALIESQGPHIESRGQCLILGRYYAESPYVYFSLNPGFARDGSPLDPRSQADANVPFANPKELRRQYVYLHNCQQFLTSHSDLDAWLNARVTAAFLVPWRTRNASELYTLNRQGHGRVFEYARELVRLIIRHHAARLLVVAGKSALTLLNDLNVPERPMPLPNFQGPSGSYQWSRSELFIDNRKIPILQIPHFSRANSAARLNPLAAWLREELKPFLHHPQSPPRPSPPVPYLRSAATR